MIDVLRRNHISISGQGDKTIVFAHGMGTNQNVWKLLTPYFEQHYRLVLFDYVGAGQSDKTAYVKERYKDLNGYAQDVIEIFDALELRDAFFLGHSVSAMIGLLASLRMPGRFAAQVMIGASPRYLNEGEGYIGGFTDQDIHQILSMMEMNFIGWASASAPVFMNNPDRPQLAQSLADTFQAEDPAIFSQFARAVFLSDHRKALSQTKTPTLVLQCAEDSVIPIEVAHYIHQNIQGSVLRMLTARGHFPMLSQPEETARVILDFLSAF